MLCIGLLFTASLDCASSEPAHTGTGGTTTTGSGSGGHVSTGGVTGTGGTDSTGAGGSAAGAGGSALDGGAGGARTDGGGSTSAGCAGKSYKLCEDFESGTVAGVPTGWTKLKGYGAGSPQDVGLATDQAHSGSMALKSDSMATGQSRVQKSLAALGATATKHWGRIFYKVQSPAVKPASGVIHITFVALMGTTENRIVDTVENTAGAHQWLYNIPDDSCCKGSSYDWKFDADWHCAEWYIDVSTSSFRFFSDSKEVTQLAFTNIAGAKMSSYGNIAVGATFYQMPPSPYVMWFDDLAIDDNQVGCQ